MIKRKLEKEYLEKEYLGSDEAGVTMLQFAIVFPVLMLLLIGVIDLARIYSVKALLQTGAEEGLSTALAIPNLDIDARSLDPANSAEFYDYYRYQWAKQHVMDAAERVPLSTLVGQTGSGNWAEVVPFQHKDSTLVSNAALLRPYECARAELGDPDGCADGESGCFRHPSLNSSTGCNSYLGNDPKTLKEEPIIVAMRAKVKTILPVFNNLEVQGLAQGFRPAIPLADVDLSDLGIATIVTTTTTITITTTTSSTTTTTTEPVVGCLPAHVSSCEARGGEIDPVTCACG